MDKVKKEVEKIRAKWLRCKIKSVEYGTSFDGIPYCFLVTQGLWFKVWIISYIKTNKELGEDSLNEEGIIRVREKQLTEKELFKFLIECRNELAAGKNDCLFSPSHIQNLALNDILKCPLPSAALESPDEYILPGDIICTSLIGPFFHSAIYVGNGQVVHVSGLGGGTSEAVARIGSFRQNFAANRDDIFILKCRHKFREPEKIVEIAKKFANNGFRRAEYSLLKRNCQHFVTLCAFGLEFSPDVAEMKKAAVTILQTIARKDPVQAVFLGNLVSRMV